MLLFGLDSARQRPQEMPTLVRVQRTPGRGIEGLLSGLHRPVNIRLITPHGGTDYLTTTWVEHSEGLACFGGNLLPLNP
jgi:hypothetical protein